MERKITIVNCVSTALEMLKFSSEQAIENAGTNKWNYVVVTWLPSPEVSKHLNKLRRRFGNRIHVINKETRPDIGYVPNLRDMINVGMDRAFELSEYAGLINTDMAFADGWLYHLDTFKTPTTIVNSQHITPISGPHVITANLGVPERGKFDQFGFDDLVTKHRKYGIQSEHERGGWMATNTMPYLIHRDVWSEYGPWELKLTGKEPPDRRFFRRCHEGGIKFTMAMASIVYHHEAVERRGKRPPGAEGLPEE